MNLRRVLSWSLAVALFLLAPVSGALAGEFESPPQLKASKLLPQDIVKGKLYTVEEKVLNDGYLNTYTIDSQYGKFTAVSTPMVYVRIHEINTIAEIDKIDLGDEFGDSVKQSGKSLVSGVKNLVTDPVDTLGGAFSGVAKAFGRAQESIFESNASQYEDSAVESAIGLSKVKRDYAVKFKVDPYSTNEVLQDRLQKLALANYSGGLGVSALNFVLPGTAAMAVSAVRGTNLMNDVDLSTAPADLRKENRDKLLAMGVEESVARIFINNEVFSPTDQSLLVAALDKCSGVKDRQAFIEFAVPTNSGDLAFFRQRMAAMFMEYHQKKAKLESFVPVGKFIAAKTANNELLLCFPLDYGVRSSAMVTVMKQFNDAAAKMGVKSKRIRVSGRFSPEAKKGLEADGWKVDEGV